MVRPHKVRRILPATGVLNGYRYNVLNDLQFFDQFMRPLPSLPVGEKIEAKSSQGVVKGPQHTGKSVTDRSGMVRGDHHGGTLHSLFKGQWAYWSFDQTITAGENWETKPLSSTIYINIDTKNAFMKGDLDGEFK